MFGNPGSFIFAQISGAHNYEDSIQCISNVTMNEHQFYCFVSASIERLIQTLTHRTHQALKTTQYANTQTGNRMLSV